MFYTISSITPVCRKLHAAGSKLVLATGFFDLLHQEHINFLRKAKAAGDVLIVAVESDERARALKGEGRPIETQDVRCQHLLDLELPAGPGLAGHNNIPARPVPNGHIVDYVISLPDDFDNPVAFEKLISVVRPDIYAVSFHSDHLKNKTLLTEKYGGQLVVVHAHNPSISTTQILNSQNHV